MVADDCGRRYLYLTGWEEHQILRLYIIILYLTLKKKSKFKSKSKFKFKFKFKQKSKKKTKKKKIYLSLQPSLVSLLPLLALRAARRE